MNEQFISERIAVTLAGDIKQPESFTWRGSKHAVVEVLRSWTDWGFSAGATQRNWRSRRHRNYYRVQVKDGLVFEIYYDRGTKPGHGAWYLYRQLDATADPSADEGAP